MFHANWPHATQLLPHAGARKTPSPPAHSWYTLTLMRPLSTEPHLSTFQTAVWFIYNSWSPPRWQRTLGSCHDGSNDQLLWSRQSSLKCWVNESLIHVFSEEEWQEPNHCPARHFPCNHTPLLSGLQTFPLPPEAVVISFVLLRWKLESRNLLSAQPYCLQSAEPELDPSLSDSESQASFLFHLLLNGYWVSRLVSTLKYFNLLSYLILLWDSYYPLATDREAKVQWVHLFF